MKKLFTVLALTLLALVPMPAYACQNCLTNGNCGFAGDNLRCRPTINGCYSGSECFTVPSTALAGDYRIASVEITHGAVNKKSVVYARK
jgi:hypothetical protein